MKRILSLAIVLTLLLGTVTTAFAANLDLINQVDEAKSFSWNDFIRVSDNLRYVGENIDDYLIEYNKQYYSAKELDETTKDGTPFLEAIEKLEPVEEPVDELKVVEVSAINATQIKVVFNKEVDKTTAEDETKYKINGVALADGTTVGATPAQAKAVLQDDKKTVILTLADVKANNVAFSFQVDGVKDVTKAETVKSSVYTLLVNDTEAPEVIKVEIVANGNLEITFDEPLQAVNPIVRVNNLPVTITAVVAGDTKVVVPATNLPAIAKGATATVYVAGAKDTAGNEMAIYNGTVVKPNDTTKPTVVSVTQIGQNSVRFVFDKVLGSGANDFAAADIKVLKGTTLYSNGDTASTVITVTKNTTVDPSGKTYDVTFDLGAAGSPLYGIYSVTSSTQTVTLMIDAGAVADAYGNEIDTFTQAFTFTKDTTGPQFVKAEVASDRQTIEVTFDEAITSGTTNIDEAKIIITDANGVRYVALDTETDVKTGAGNEKILLVDFISSTGTMPNGTYTLNFQEGVVTDLYGNKNAAFSTTVTVGDAEDTTKPVPVLDGTSTENNFVVDFGEEVTASALNVANYKLDGEALPDGTITYFTDANKDKVAIVLPEGSINIGVVGTGADAILNVSNVADKAGNLVDSTNLVVKISDNTPAVAQSLQVIGNDIIITFNEDIDNASATAINTPALLAADFEIKVGSEVLNLGTQDSSATGGTDPAVAVSLVPGAANKVRISLTPVVIGTGGTPAGDGIPSNWDPTKTITVKILGATLKDANLYGVKANVSVSN